MNNLATIIYRRYNKNTYENQQRSNIWEYSLSKGIRTLGELGISDAYPSHIRLTANGIDLVDEITNQIIEDMKKSTEDQQEMKTIVNGNLPFCIICWKKLLGVFLGIENIST